MKISIKNPAPVGEYLTKWGDYHFGEALQRALEALGVEVEQHFWPDWDVDAAEDVVLVLRGKREWLPPEPRGDRQYVMWVLSHPADITAAECEAYDRVYSASETHQRLLAAVIRAPVGLLRQCTDTTRFQPSERSLEEEARMREDLLFVGNSRNVRRELAQWAVDIDRPPVIIGREWERFGFKPFVRSKWVANDELPALYQRARFCLNDHWHDMRAFGMINNRIFDALACGLPVISDHFPELEDVLGDAVMYVRSAGELRAALDRAEADYPAVLGQVAEKWQALAGEFSFARRAEQLLEDLNTPAKKTAARRTVSVPRAWLGSLEQSLREQSILHERIRDEQEQRAKRLGEEIRQRKARWSELKEKLDEARQKSDVQRAQLAQKDNELAQKDNELAQKDNELAQKDMQLEDAIRERKRKWSEIKRKLDQARQENEDLETQLRAVSDNLKGWQQGGKLVQRELQKLLQSRSWKLSAPVRWLGGLARGQGASRGSAQLALKKFEQLAVSAPRAPSKPQKAAKAPRARPNRGAGGGKVPFSIRKLEAKLWGGYVQGALAELQAVLEADSSSTTQEQVWAAWALARWHQYQGNYEQALGLTEKMMALDARRAHDKRPVLLAADALMALGRREEAAARLQSALDAVPDQADLTLALAAAQDNADQRVTVVNALYENAGLAPLIKREPEQPLRLDNLTAEAPGLPASAMQATVSVVMPVFNAAGSIEMAIASLLAQTWAELEIIAVDDCSEDDTVAVLERLAARDDRVRVHRQPANGGAYAARNAGLALATGDFITTHDSDDWSHPQKLERQVRALESDTKAQASVSFWCRTAPDLVFHGTERPSGKYLQWNHSSLMVRREAMARLGGWDQVRVGADTELVHRLGRLYGADAITEVEPGVPLSFALAESTSLTRAKATSAVTLYQGLRREYREAWAHWHEYAPSDEAFRLDPAAEQRPFPAPRLNLPGPRSLQEYDLLFVMDWNLGGGAYVSSLNYVQAARRLGLKVAVWHRRRPDLDLSRPLNPAIRQLAAEGEVTVVSAGESLRARHVLIGYPPIFREPMENPPRVEAETIGVIVNQMADRLYSAKDPQYDPREVRENIVRELGQPPMWLPISGHVRELIEADPRYEGRLSVMDWNPLIDLPDSPPAGREWGRGEPVVGRHARDHYTKWPARASEIEAAYLADKPCRVELMGGAEVPEKILGRLPSNWAIHPFNSMPTPEFLARLHFFVHYPNDDYIEEFGRSVIEAISHGVICILPPRFEATFGPAAVYAEPAAVWSEVEALWGDKALRDQQIHDAAQFVANCCTYSVLDERLANLERV